MQIDFTREQLAKELRSAFRLLRRVEGNLKIIATDNVDANTMRALSEASLTDLSEALCDLNLIGKRVGME